MSRPHADRPAPLCGMPPAAAGTGVAIERARGEAIELIRRDALVRPAIAYRIHAARAHDAQTLQVGGTALAAPGLAQARGEVTALAAAACTIGPALETRVSALFAARRPLLALALDAAGTDALYRLSETALARIAREAGRRGMGAGEPLNPGDPGIPLERQAAVLALADSRSCGVALTGAGMLSPAKSLTFFLALGPGLPARPGARTRCLRCPSRDRCGTRIN